MEASWIVAVCNGSWSHFTHETIMYGYTTQDEKIVFRRGGRSDKITTPVLTTQPTLFFTPRVYAMLLKGRHE
jgi:hypothetical protein